MERQTYPGYEPPLNLRSNNNDTELLTRQDCHIGHCIHMAWRLNACVRAPEPGPVDYAGYRINDPLWGPCKHITGVQDVRAIDEGSTCLSHPWVQFRQIRPRAETRTFATHVPLVIYAGVELSVGPEYWWDTLGPQYCWYHDYKSLGHEDRPKTKWLFHLSGGCGKRGTSLKATGGGGCRNVRL